MVSVNLCHRLVFTTNLYKNTQLSSSSSGHSFSFTRIWVPIRSVHGGSSIRTLIASLRPVKCTSEGLENGYASLRSSAQGGGFAARKLDAAASARQDQEEARGRVRGGLGCLHLLLLLLPSRHCR